MAACAVITVILFSLLSIALLSFIFKSENASSIEKYFLCKLGFLQIKDIYYNFE